MGSLKHFPQDLAKARIELSKKWGLKGNLGLANLGDGKALLEFSLKGEESRVLQKGARIFLNFKIELRGWKPSEGCLLNPEVPKELCVRLLGLPVHLWVAKILKKLGDAYEGFPASGSCSRVLSNLHWARILFRVGGWKLPRELEIKMGRKNVKI